MTYNIFPGVFKTYSAKTPRSGRLTRAETPGTGRPLFNRSKDDRRWAGPPATGGIHDVAATSLHGWPAAGEEPPFPYV
jgi:hypothetical protein